MKSFLRSISTSRVDPTELLDQLDAFDIDWWVSDAGDLLIRYWQVGAEDFVPIERVAEVRANKTPPGALDRLEWVSRELDSLRSSYAGRWVAIGSAGVIASGATLAELLSAIEGIDEQPFVTQISQDPVVWNTAYANDEVV